MNWKKHKFYCTINLFLSTWPWHVLHSKPASAARLCDSCGTPRNDQRECLQFEVWSEVPQQAATCATAYNSNKNLKCWTTRVSLTDKMHKVPPSFSIWRWKEIYFVICCVLFTVLNDKALKPNEKLPKSSDIPARRLSGYKYKKGDHCTHKSWEFTKYK